jgi:transcriptional regulator with XRE-family HTH domain
MPKEDDFSLLKLRTALGLPQAEMARRMGLSLRPYQELESKVRTTRSRHIRLAELVALEVAVENDDPNLAPQDIRRLAIKLAIAILMANLPRK